MLLEWRLERSKKKLDKCVERYGLNHKKTFKISDKTNKLINEYYKKNATKK